MAQRNFESVISMICGGNYTAIVQHWKTEDATAANSFTLSKKLRDGLETPDAGNSIIEALAACLADDCYVSSVRVTEMAPGSSTAVKLFPIADWPGSFGSDMDAAQVAGVLVWVTGSSDVENGRNFIPGVAEEAYEYGRPKAPYLAALAEYKDRMLAGVDMTTHQFVFALKNGDPVNYTTIAHGYLSPTAGTMRKRLVPY